ncbi:hypothetical protein [Halobacillus yeomjeoni]|uniref:Uncharacterized protein n=1 Tax=Halobacillus yeomjeoni TaxID=311194 RepID=A0A931HXW9_9BACI|nr:hypothetical protein [Halobacillus yeomjeoni]MBH0231281.1 hypothetical protein [Halobacillus yeomjeoni]
MKKIIIAGLTLLIGFGGWLVYHSTSEIPENKHLIEKMNDKLKEQNHFKKGTLIKKVQGRQLIDERHLYIPVVFENGSRGKSLWVDGWFKWKLVRVDTDGSPEVWEIDPEKPSTFHVIYHLEGVDSMDLYYREELYWSISNGKETFYQPPIQLKKEVAFDERNYGAVELPQVWSDIRTKTSDLRRPKMNLGYITYDENQKVISPSPSSDTAYSFGGSEKLSFVIYLNKNDIVE